jgi:hypothetical protein
MATKSTPSSVSSSCVLAVVIGVGELRRNIPWRLDRDELDAWRGRGGEGAEEPSPPMVLEADDDDSPSLTRRRTFFKHENEDLEFIVNGKTYGLRENDVVEGRILVLLSGQELSLFLQRWAAAARRNIRSSADAPPHKPLRRCCFAKDSLKSSSCKLLQGRMYRTSA